MLIRRFLKPVLSLLASRVRSSTQALTWDFEKGLELLDFKNEPEVLDLQD